RGKPRCLVTMQTDELGWLVLRPLNIAWFQALRNSPRNSRVTPSCSRAALMTDRSHWLTPSPRTSFRRDGKVRKLEPSCFEELSSKPAPVLNQRVGVRSPRGRVMSWMSPTNRPLPQERGGALCPV